MQPYGTDSQAIIAEINKKAQLFKVYQYVYKHLNV